MVRRLVYPVVALALAVPVALPAAGDGKVKTLSGKVRAVEENRLVVKKSGLFSADEMEFVLTDDTKKTGQLAPGMHVKLKYREEKTDDGEIRRVVIEIEARPEYASKKAKKLAKDPKPEP